MIKVSCAYACLAVAFLLIPGCGNRYKMVDDGWKTQPLSSRFESVQSILEVSVGVPFHSKGRLNWKDFDGHVYNADDLARLAIDMANAYGCDTSPVLDVDEEWCSIGNQAKENPLSMEVFMALYRQTIVVVCVDPLVVVVSDSPIISAYGGDDFNAFPAASAFSDLNDVNGEKYVAALLGGVVYGTEISCHSNSLVMLSSEFLPKGIMIDFHASKEFEVETSSGRLCITLIDQVVSVLGDQGAG